MPLDGLTLLPAVWELQEKLRYARIMKIYQPDSHTLLLHLRQPGANYRLLLSADPTYPRIHWTQYQPDNPLNPPGFCMLLRKYLEPSRILSIEQHGLERVVTIDLETFDADGQHSQKALVFELLGRHSNIVILDAQGRIMDAIRRTPAGTESDRPYQPGQTYTLPPDQGKVNPLRLTESEFIEAFRFAPGTLALEKVLQQILQGFSRQGALAAVRRAGFAAGHPKQDTDAQQWSQLWQGIQSLLSELQAGGTPKFWEGERFEFSGYDQDRDGGQSFPTVNDLLDYVFTTRVAQQHIQQAANTLLRSLKTHRKRVERKERLQQDTLADAKELERWKQYGELITANLYRIGQGSEAVVENFYDPEQAEISIPMDPTLTPNENAQAYFKRYNKAKTSLTMTKRQLRKTRQEKQYLEELAVQIEMADSPEVLEEIRSEMIAAGLLKAGRRKPRRQKRSQQMAPSAEEYVSSDGFTILLGRSNTQNDTLTFKVARPDDLWLHAQKIPGSHVIIRNGQSISDTALEEAATLAARFCRSHASPKVPVDYTLRKHVRKPPGSPPGFVIYDDFQTVLVNPTDSAKLPQKSTKKRR